MIRLARTLSSRERLRTVTAGGKSALKVRGLIFGKKPRVRLGKAPSRLSKKSLHGEGQLCRPTPKCLRPALVGLMRVGRRLWLAGRLPVLPSTLS